MRTVLPDTDHLTSYDNWLATQNGGLVESYAGQIDSQRRYIRNARDLATWVHMDVLFQAYFNACLILITPPNDDPTATASAARSTRATRTSTTPTRSASPPSAPPYIKGLMCEVATRALKVTWHQKW